MIKVVYSNKNELTQFIKIFCNGLIDFIKQREMSYDESWDWLFSTDVSDQLARCGLPDKLIEILDSGNELETAYKVSKVSPAHRKLFVESCDQLMASLHEIPVTQLKKGSQHLIFVEDKDEDSYHEI